MDSVMIALLPMTTHWSELELPHLTLVYSGKVSDHKATDFNEIAKDASSLSMLARPLSLEITGIERLGTGEDIVDAFMLRPTTELLAMRNFVKRWHKSEFDTYRPHATIGKPPISLDVTPTRLAFNRIMVGWGEERLTFFLGA